MALQQRLRQTNNYDSEIMDRTDTSNGVVYFIYNLKSTRYCGWGQKSSEILTEKNDVRDTISCNSV